MLTATTHRAAQRRMSRRSCVSCTTIIHQLDAVVVATANTAGGCSMQCRTVRCAMQSSFNSAAPTESLDALLPPGVLCCTAAGGKLTSPTMSVTSLIRRLPVSAAGIAGSSSFNRCLVHSSRFFSSQCQPLTFFPSSLCCTSQRGSRSCRSNAEVYQSRSTHTYIPLLVC